MNAIAQQIYNTEPMEIQPPPAYPVLNNKAYYGISGEIATLATNDSEADKAAVLMSFLAISAAMIGSDKYLMVGETQFTTKLFIALAGNSSRARKGTSLKPVIRIKKETEKILQEKHNLNQPLMIGDGGLSSAEGLIYQVRDESEQLNKDGEPIWEGVADKRFCVIEEELGNVLKMAQREGNTLSPMLRRAWDGGTLAPMTKNNRLSSTNAHICLLSHITRMELNELFKGSDIYNGLANRFLWCCVRRTHLVPFPKPMPDNDVMTLANKLASNLLAINSNQEVNLSPQAKQLWVKLYKDVSQDCQGIIGAITARAEAHIIRLAMVYCLLDGKNIITIDHLSAATSVWDYCKASAIYLFSFHDPEERDPNTELLLEALKNEPLSQTQISGLFGRHKTAKELNSFLSEMEGANLIKQEKLKTKGRAKILWKLVK